MEHTTSCLFCSASNPPNTRLCGACGAKMLTSFSAQSGSKRRLDISEDQQQFPLPVGRYASELMAQLSWAAQDFLNGEIEESDFEDELAKVHEAFSEMDEQIDSLESWLLTLIDENSEDPMPSQALFYGLRGVELFRQGLDQIEDFLDDDEAEDDELKDAVTAVLDGNDHLAHCYVILQSTPTSTPAS